MASAPFAILELSKSYNAMPAQNIKNKISHGISRHFRFLIMPCDSVVFAAPLLDKPNLKVKFDLS
jgi:hypothetical protein